MPDIKPEEIEDPKVFCHLAGHPPLEGETMRQYLERVVPLIGKNQPKEPTDLSLVGWRAASITLLVAFTVAFGILALVAYLGG